TYHAVRRARSREHFMSTYRAPVRETAFIIRDVLNYQRFGNIAGYGELPPDVLDAILEEGARLAENIMQPLNRTGDMEGCTRHEDGTVSTPKGFKDGYRQYCQGGWMGLSAPAEYGGQGLPYLVHTAVGEY